MPWQRTEKAEYENYRKGFELIYKQLMDNLAKLGVERIDPAGQPFDPHQHQAVDRAESTDKPDGTVLQVFQPGICIWRPSVAASDGACSGTPDSRIEVLSQLILFKIKKGSHGKRASKRFL